MTTNTHTWPTFVRADVSEASFDPASDTVTLPLDPDGDEPALVALMEADSTAFARMAASHPRVRAMVVEFARIDGLL
jgi:hypothetical protein